MAGDSREHTGKHLIIQSILILVATGCGGINESPDRCTGWKDSFGIKASSISGITTGANEIMNIEKRYKEAIWALRLNGSGAIVGIQWNICLEATKGDVESLSRIKTLAKVYGLNCTNLNRSDLSELSKLPSINFISVPGYKSDLGGSFVDGPIFYHENN